MFSLNSGLRRLFEPESEEMAVGETP